MTVQYQVVGAAAHATIQSPTGRVRQLHFKGTVLPADVPQVEIDHLLSVKLIQPVAGLDALPVEPEPQVPPAADDTPSADTGDGDDDGDDEQEAADRGEAEQAPDPDVEQKRAEARAKLPADGSKPDGRAGAPVWAEWLVTKGYDYATLAKADKKELVELANGLT